MKQELHKELLQHTSELRTLLATCSSYSTVGMCATYFLNHPERKERKDRLVAPARQIFFLLGVMLTTPEPAEPRQFDQSDWEKSTDLLNRIFSTYSWMYWPTRDELPTLTEEWKHARMVAMPAFLHFFATSLMASVEQIRHRTERYGIPFDDQVMKQTELRVTQTLAITNWIAESLQRQIDDLVADFRKFRESTFAARTSRNCGNQRNACVALVNWKAFPCSRPACLPRPVSRNGS